ncbi:hypothetical protein PABG_02218 [Paracoccidioides brasiliensis Pb03]|uniref:BZIP domain-containing protein n=2 Tax=Paracoccidioides brasiliensis TaxID=121759 RepID=C1G179_PARBD|nr:uncharacterized protein PADG_00619 [Paracoccidioides brasiliensis Pb18]EEH19959.1 hypothetical protein PABG_02218 [Paracoccidioides brasiliensis Pb03]EEH44330.1 hypothetical protein PADG_00619 [Paracoccidioides brasiliensis Pb18]ODH25859.1 hypothetical protein ACO22_05015 [Paracoccidioides brasiliensis]ODH53506.1 hypothetical protein GX48_00339 [Paracoccidioides brasiliensis]
MSAAIATRPSPRIGPPASRTDSPMDPKKGPWKSDDAQSTTSDQKDTTQPNDAETSQSASNTRHQGQQPPQQPQQSGSDTPDYFSGVHGTTQFSLEPNPFEQSFGTQPADAPGKSLLPSVAALTSPALPGTSSAGGFNWSNSLRAGPLSPAMLAGPAAPSDYFDGIGRGFPTPNESSLRTGLTPGGGGSMFPAAASPNTQALMQQFQGGGGATPATLDFHRTALNAARKNARTSNPQDSSDQLLQQPANLDAVKSEAQVDPFAHHDATDAANGLFMLAKGGQANNGQFSVPTSQPVAQSRPADSGTSIQNGNNAGQDMNGGTSDSSGERTKSNARNGGGKGRKSSTGKSNGRRKADDTVNKGGMNKKTKTNNGTAVDHSMDDSEEEEDHKQQQSEGNTQKMTDEEKRKNFLERNRVAALKCRQRKKQWLQSLQTKVEYYSNENDALSSTVTQLREEIVNLKTLLLAHKDCPVSQAQGLNSIMVNSISGEYAQHPNPYMAMQAAGAPPGISSQPMPRR